MRQSLIRLLLTAFLLSACGTATEAPTVTPTAHDPFVPLDGSPVTIPTRADGTPYVFPTPTEGPFIVPTAIPLEQVRPEQVIVCVSDQGAGIEAKDLPHIFDRFYRSTAAVKQTKGAGLGLYLARAIVEAHGGRIWADSSTGTGAKICFSLPR